MGLSRDRVAEGYEARCDQPGCGYWDLLHTGWRSAAAHRLYSRGWECSEEGDVWTCPGCARRKPPLWVVRVGVVLAVMVSAGLVVLGIWGIYTWMTILARLVP